MEITCYRDDAFASEWRTLPAEIYNLATTLLARAPDGQLFVPIRTMQMLTIIDHEEFVFIDGERKCWIDIAWRNFKPQERESLTAPVSYEAVYYRPESANYMNQLHSEFPSALQQLAAKEKPDVSAKVLKFPTQKNPAC
ncbi:MAG: hypothetical protein LBE24_05410 [Methylobacillus sp.]|jgi:hypothetical protein|nr:hypothetical protein [Methylobacillus sp.]